MKTTEELRQLIEEYRERLTKKGDSVAMVTFILGKIEEAERKLNAAASETLPSSPRATPSL